MPTRRVLPNDGERMVPAYHQGRLFYGEHIIRYKSAQELVRGKTVLDIACGSGYGTKMLAATAKKVYGVDVNNTAIQYAKKNYTSPKIDYRIGDAVEIPLEDGAVDVVVSFETIEHISQYEEFINEIKRVLKPGGLFIVSTPNNEEYPETNPFHVHEFSFKELDRLLSKHFLHSKHFYQATWLYSALLDKKMIETQWDKSIRTLQVVPLNTDKSVYYFSLCSDSIITTSPQPIGALSEYSSIREEENRKTQIEEMSRKITELNDESERLENKIHLIENSRVWRLRGKIYKMIGRG